MADNLNVKVYNYNKTDVPFERILHVMSTHLEFY